MYFKCSWCGARLSNQPLYHSDGFLDLKPRFKVYCDASCSLSAYQACSKSSNNIGIARKKYPD